MHTGRLPLTGRVVHYGCIHNLEKDCDILNLEIGDCVLDIDDKIVWRCPYYRCNVYED